MDIQPLSKWSHKTDGILFNGALIAAERKRISNCNGLVARWNGELNILDHFDDTISNVVIMKGRLFNRRRIDWKFRGGGARRKNDGYEDGRSFHVSFIFAESV